MKNKKTKITAEEFNDYLSPVDDGKCKHCNSYVIEEGDRWRCPICGDNGHIFFEDEPSDTDLEYATRIVKLEKKLELITTHLSNFNGSVCDEIRQNLINELNKIDKPKGKPTNIKRWLRPV